MKKAINECIKCKFTWEDLPGGLAKFIHPLYNETRCPNCGNKYWKWINYNEKK